MCGIFILYLSFLKKIPTPVLAHERGVVGGGLQVDCCCERVAVTTPLVFARFLRGGVLPAQDRRWFLRIVLFVCGRLHPPPQPHTPPPTSPHPPPPPTT